VMCYFKIFTKPEES